MVSESRQTEAREAQSEECDEKPAQPVRLYYEIKGGIMIKDAPRGNKRNKQDEISPETTPATSAKRSKRRISQEKLLAHRVLKRDAKRDKRAKHEGSRNKAAAPTRPSSTRRTATTTMRTSPHPSRPRRRRTPSGSSSRIWRRRGSSRSRCTKPPRRHERPSSTRPPRNIWQTRNMIACDEERPKPRTETTSTSGSVYERC